MQIADIRYVQLIVVLFLQQFHSEFPLLVRSICLANIPQLNLSSLAIRDRSNLGDLFLESVEALEPMQYRYLCQLQVRLVSLSHQITVDRIIQRQ